MRRALPLFTSLLLIHSCAPSGGESLTRVTSSGPSATCPAGGVVIATGKDANANGKLDDSEVKEQSEVCSGADASGNKTSLVETVDLPVGDATCSNGGVRLDTGFDDGANGGAASNGKLEPGEVVSSRFICNGGTPYYPGSISAPANPAGASRVETTGGAGNGAQGGAAGSISVRITSGTLGGHVRVFKTGVADPSFTPPSSSAFNGGAHLLSVTADTTINNYPNVGAGLGSGDPFFLVDNDETLYRNNAGQAVPATGIAINMDQTLRFNRNFGDEARVRVRNDVRNAGDITTTVLGDGVSLGTLRLTCSNFWGEAGSSISLRGNNQAVGNGGNGGAFVLTATAKAVNSGSITTSGGDGDNGGSGATLLLSSVTAEVFNTGTLEAKGGIGSVGGGGNGGAVQLFAGYRGVRNSGSVEATGGMGAPNGGNGGDISFAPITFGLIYNTATLTTRGGLCSDADCTGGSGGSVQLISQGGELRNSGLITTSGGDGRGANNGGNGGGIRLESKDAAANSLALAAGELIVSGNLVSRGGNGNAGGSGGAVNVLLDATHLPRGQQLSMLGYAELLANGGASANANGANGGAITITNARSLYQDSVNAPGGAALNSASLTAKGGDGKPSGAGGPVLLAAQRTFNFNNPNEFANNSGAIDVRGGAGDNGEGGNGGQVTVAGPAAATNSGTIDASGGAVTAGGNGSGAGGAFVLSAPYGSATNTGTVTVSGGQSTGDARGGGTATVQSQSTTSSGAITCAGGNATNTAGNGGLINLVSTVGVTSSSGTLSVAGGTGTNAGSKGTVVVDGADVTP